MVLMAVVLGLGLLFHTFLGFRYGLRIRLGTAPS